MLLHFVQRTNSLLTEFSVGFPLQRDHPGQQCRVPHYTAHEGLNWKSVMKPLPNMLQKLQGKKESPVHKAVPILCVLLEQQCHLHPSNLWPPDPSTDSQHLGGILHQQLEGNGWALRDGFRAWQGDDILYLHFYCISWLEGSYLKHFNWPKVKDIQMSKIKCVKAEPETCQWITQWTVTDSRTIFSILSMLVIRKQFVIHSFTF